MTLLSAEAIAAIKQRAEEPTPYHIPTALGTLGWFRVDVTALLAHIAEQDATIAGVATLEEELQKAINQLNTQFAKNMPRQEADDARITALECEINRLTFHASDGTVAALNAADMWQTRAERAEAALRTYGDHTQTCARVLQYYDDLACTCGWTDEAVAILGKEP